MPAAMQLMFSRVSVRVRAEDAMTSGAIWGDKLVRPLSMLLTVIEAVFIMRSAVTLPHPCSGAMCCKESKYLVPEGMKVFLQDR